MFFDCLRNTIIEPDLIQNWMSCLWMKNDWVTIGTEYKSGIIFSVKKQVELMLRMVLRDPFYYFIGKPTNSFQFVWK